MNNMHEQRSAVHEQRSAAEVACAVYGLGPASNSAGSSRLTSTWNLPPAKDTVASLPESMRMQKPQSFYAKHHDDVCELGCSLSFMCIKALFKSCYMCSANQVASLTCMCSC